MYSTITHLTDLSAASIPALQEAHELAKTLHAKLLVCYVARPPLVASGNKLTNPKTNETRDIAEELESHQPGDPAVERELRILVADQSMGIKKLLEFLEEMEGDLLILGMHKKSGVAGWFGSSITEEIVRHAHCTVMVVRD